MKNRIAPNYKIIFYLCLGLATAISFRALIIIDHLEPEWVRPVWYFAVLGNFLFFHYRFRVTIRRKKAVVGHDLIGKLERDEPLALEAREDLLYILRSIQRSPENINYLIISLFSLVAIAIDLVITYLGN